MAAPEASRTALVVGIGGQDAAYLSALLLGSETQKVLTHSTMPVLVVR